jgi:DNA polymerase-3 subunit delta
MAKAKSTGADYGAAVSKLKIHGPGRLYLLWGEEDYLRERFLDELRHAVLGENADDFNYKRMEGRGLDLRRLEEAVNAVPFLGDRCLVEVRDFDLNGCRDEAFPQILEQIPETTTVGLVQDIDNPPDGRLGLVKKLRQQAEALEFTAQGQARLAKWIGQRFAWHGKQIARQDAEYLIFVSGSLMNQLIPEIEKLSNYVNSDAVTRADIDAVAIRLPEARVFELTDALSRRDFDGAARILSELLLSRESPVS